MTGTQFICNFCNEIIDTYDDKDEMLQHIKEHSEECQKNISMINKDVEIPKGKFPVEELKSYLEQTIRNDDESIDFLHNSRGKKDEDWYEKWSLNKIKAYLGDVLYSPVCNKLCLAAGIDRMREGNEEFDKLLSVVITEIVNGIW